MGWKSTINITRDEAIKAIVGQMVMLNNKTNKELENMLENYSFGNDPELKWYGYNFIIIDNE